MSAEILGIITIIIVQGSAILKTYLNNRQKKAESEKRHNITLSKIDDINNNQTNEINEIKHTIVNINNKYEILLKETKSSNELIKHKRFREQLEVSIYDLLNDILKNKLVKNTELQILAEKAIENAIKVFKYILIKEFNVDCNSLMSKFISTARNVKSHVNFNKLSVQKEFYEDTKRNIVIPAIELFIFDFKRLRPLENGIRRGEFQDACLKLTKIILNTTIENYKKYKV